jgi:hypothetical protein
VLARSKILLAAVVWLVGAGVAVGGYVIGLAVAPSEPESRQARVNSYAQSAEQAEAEAGAISRVAERQAGEKVDGQLVAGPEAARTPGRLAPCWRYGRVRSPRLKLF